MPRFDVFEARDADGYLLDVQASSLDRLRTRVVVPLIPADRAQVEAGRLFPRFQIAGTSVAMLTPALNAVRRDILRDKVDNLERHRLEIVGAIDFLLQGF